MNPKWHFNPRRPCDRMRDLANDAFFTAESLENLSEALVREGIQNSLDAARRDAGGVRQVTIRICLVPKATAEVRKFLSDNFSSAQPNFERGLVCPDLKILFGADCGYLVLEDFGTRGLTGGARTQANSPTRNCIVATRSGAVFTTGCTSMSRMK